MSFELRIGTSASSGEAATTVIPLTEEKYRHQAIGEAWNTYLDERRRTPKDVVFGRGLVYENDVLINEICPTEKAVEYDLKKPSR